MGRRRRERPSERSLVCVIQSLVGMKVLVELRNDLLIRGTLDECDDGMNIIVSNAVTETVMGEKVELPAVFVRGRLIRFVHMPAKLDVSRAVEERRAALDRAELAYMGGKGLAPGQRTVNLKGVDHLSTGGTEEDASGSGSVRASAMEDS